MDSIKLPWIQAGYTLFAQEGPSALKVEVLARIVGKSKSSFYHHFADLEVFTEELLNHHLHRSAIMGEAERACQNIDPELLQVIIDFQEDLFFNRQLRVNRQVPAFQECFQKAAHIVGDAIVPIWAAELGLTDRSDAAAQVLQVTMENFFLQITEQSLSMEWLRNYMGEIRSMVNRVKS